MDSLKNTMNDGQNDGFRGLGLGNLAEQVRNLEERVVSQHIEAQNIRIFEHNTMVVQKSMNSDPDIRNSSILPFRAPLKASRGTGLGFLSAEKRKPDHQLDQDALALEMGKPLIVHIPKTCTALKKLALWRINEISVQANNTFGIPADTKSAAKAQEKFQDYLCGHWR